MKTLAALLLAGIVFGSTAFADDYAGGLADMDTGGSADMDTGGSADMFKRAPALDEPPAQIDSDANPAPAAEPAMTYQKFELKTETKTTNDLDDPGSEEN